MAGAAADWLASLDDGQRATACWPFPSDDERERWYYTPTDHGGLPLADMGARQQHLAMRLLASGLSTPGYVTAATIISLENILDDAEGWKNAGRTRERQRDPNLYYFSVFGEPGAEAWSWRVGGHHLSVHLTVLHGEVIASSPCFFGTDPASSPLLGPHQLRPLASVEDYGRDLVRSLGEDQLARAMLAPHPPIDVVSGNRARIASGDGPMLLADAFRETVEGEQRERSVSAQRRLEETIGFGPLELEAVRYTNEPKGVPVSMLAPSQREILLLLLHGYLDRIADEAAQREWDRLGGDGLEQLAFAWAGSTEPGRPHYYRVQGPRLLVEYDNTQRDANHVHAVWRDPVNDFGRDVLADHYRTGGH
jgi:hypothetical protein